MRLSTALGHVISLAIGAGCASADTVSEKPATEQPAPAPGEGTPGGGEADAAGAVEPASACTSPVVGEVADVTVDELKQRIESGAKLAVIDVREPDETAQGIIEGALLFPWTSKVLQAKHGELPSDRPLFVICRSGNRSVAASTFLAESGHGCVHNVTGGMIAWTAAGYPTTK